MITGGRSMGYKLRYKLGVGAVEQITSNPSPETIDSVIDELLPPMDHYIVLSSDERVKNCDCIQTVIKDKDDKPTIEYMVEVCFKNDEGFAFYRKYIGEINEVKRLFRMFALEVIPDIHGWDDVTEDVKKSIEKHKQERGKNYDAD
jgi:hypothetical protein